MEPDYIAWKVNEIITATISRGYIHAMYAGYPSWQCQIKCGLNDILIMFKKRLVIEAV
jgi:hypothetical protein